MESNKQIMDRYDQADEAQRLSLYLTHRDLRTAFIEIEMAKWARVRPQGNATGVTVDPLRSTDQMLPVSGIGEQAPVSKGALSIRSFLIRLLKGCCPSATLK